MSERASDVAGRNVVRELKRTIEHDSRRIVRELWDVNKELMYRNGKVCDDEVTKVVRSRLMSSFQW